jgi:predicted hydrocarbon binding protein
MEDAQSIEPLVKGASLIGFFKYVKDWNDGENLIEKVLDALPSESADICRQKVIAVADYPYSLFADLIRAIDRVIGSGDLSVCEELGRYAAARDIKAFLDTFKSEVGPKDLMRAADIMWKSYHINSGAIETDDTSPENFVIRICDFPKMDNAHCRLMAGYFGQAMISVGGSWTEDIREVKCSSRGDPYHEFQGKWK